MVTTFAEHDLARACVAQMLKADRTSDALGMRLEAIAPGAASVSMRVRPDMVNGHGLAHGGIIASLADSAFAFACNSRGIVTVASGFDISFVEPAKLDDRLVARAVEVALKGRSGIYDVTVVRDTVTIAEFRGRSRSLGRPVLETRS